MCQETGSGRVTLKEDVSSTDRWSVRENLQPPRFDMLFCKRNGVGGRRVGVLSKRDEVCGTHPTEDNDPLGLVNVKDDKNKI